MPVLFRARRRFDKKVSPVLIISLEKKSVPWRGTDFLLLINKVN